MISWEWSYDAFKKVLNEEIHEVKIYWKTNYLVTWRTGHCNFNVVKNDVRICKLDTKNNDVTCDARNIVLAKQET